MWIFTQKGFLSVVAHNTKPDILIVRSRFKGHIEKIFGAVCVLDDAQRDYRFRAELPIKEVANVISRLVSQIDYDNFKNSLNIYDEKYLDCCLDVYNSVARISGDWDLDKWQKGN
jgi:hypothetical protein